jgi:hypothetical protein
MNTADLLHTLRPLLRMDSRDRWSPVSAEAFCRLAVLRTEKGRVIDPAPSLASLRRVYADGTPARPGDYLELPHSDWRGIARDVASEPPLLYGQAIEDGEDVWLQWWMCYVRNDTPMTLGNGAHQGDWERFAVLIRDGFIIRAVGSQHKVAEGHGWMNVEKHDGRPVIYPRLGTHAVSFSPGWAWLGGSFDIGNGRREIDPAVEIISPESHPWTAWPGRWGLTKKRGRVQDFIVRGPIPSRTPAKLTTRMYA